MCRSVAAILIQLHYTRENRYQGSPIPNIIFKFYKWYYKFFLGINQNLNFILKTVKGIINMAKLHKENLLWLEHTKQAYMHVLSCSIICVKTFCLGYILFSKEMPVLYKISKGKFVTYILVWNEIETYEFSASSYTKICR